MAITFPRTDIVTASLIQSDGWEFDPVSLQELSRQANGVTRGKDLGSALWVLSCTTRPMNRVDLVAYLAALRSLDGVIGTFTAGDLRRPYPASLPTGVFTDGGSIHTVGAKSLRLKGLAAGLVLTVGDYLRFTYNTTSIALHQIMETVTTAGDGVTPTFEVRPHLRATAAEDAAVTLKNPTGLFTLLPNSITPPQKQDGDLATVSFKAGQYL